MPESTISTVSPSQPEPLEQRDDAASVSAVKLSVIILTYNEEANLPACIQSLTGLPCNLFVVDSGSTDSTVAIAAEHAASVVSHPFDNYSAQRNWSQQNLPIETPWVLHLDADERLTPELVVELKQVLADPPAGIAGFLLRKRTIFMGKWIRHGGHYPSYHLRLFRTGAGRCEDRLYDQHFVVEGALAKLDHDYLDVVASKLSTWTVRHSRWAEMEAREILGTQTATGQVVPDAFGNPIQRRRWMRNTYVSGPLFVRAAAYWFYRYFLRLGFLDGTPGLIFHFLQGFWFRFLVDATIYEQKQRGAN